ncbi:MAG: FAD:protein FMN transferase [Rubrobacteraceae bacterium]|nr:FAD:protein FMN transferase [Rubrobacteraceae bacterium]
MGTEIRLVVVTDDPGPGDEALRRAVDDLESTEQALSRFRPESELSRLNREGAMIAGGRLRAAIEASVQAYEWSGGLLDPRVISSLEAFGYASSLPRSDVGVVTAPGGLKPVEMRRWIEEDTGRVTLPPGVRLDLAGVGKALAIGWAAMQLAGHAGLLVDVGGDIVALGRDERGDPWRVAVKHDKVVGEFSGDSLAVATSTTTLRAWKAGGRRAHHLIDPRTGAPVESDLLFATVAAPTIIEADLGAKLLILGGIEAAAALDERCRAVVTDRRGRTISLTGRRSAERAS